ncbi:MAG: putative sulfate exporter family transporter [Rhizobiales bacterium]|nr:putative sulfate exporter family transporter [Hyphomicrobiales bacterium]
MMAEAEGALLGRVWLEPLVLAILLGSLLRTVLPRLKGLDAGVAFSARLPLEVAIVLLGLSVDAGFLAGAGARLLAGVVAIVVLALAAGYGIGRLLGLRHEMALLVAAGNAICGNSAIAAAAPVIGAGAADVAASIAFTAVLGIATVLLLPLLVPLLGLDPLQYGVIAGLSVYAVPQVLAATAPIGLASVQMGTIVKLLRVMMLGPVLLVLALAHGREGVHVPVSKLIPWFLLGFFALAAIRALDIVPQAGLDLARTASTALTVVAMAALGLGSDLRALSRSGGRVALAAALSLAALVGASLVFIRIAAIA